MISHTVKLNIIVNAGLFLQARETSVLSLSDINVLNSNVVSEGSV